MPDLKPDHLIVRYLSNEASAVDQEYLFEWVSRNKENQRIFNAYVAAWSKQTHNLKVFDAQDAWKRLSSKIEEFETVERKKTVFWNRWNIAAAVVFIVTAGFILYHTGRNAYEAHAEFLPKEFVTTANRDTIRLADGSIVTLNVNSALKYPETFSGETREVYLTGEAFFEVAKDSSRPFIIHTGKVTTQVTGTSFNINAKDSSVIVSVATGHVTVSDGSVIERIQSYEKVVCSSNDFRKSTTDLSELEWTDRALKFDGTPLEEVIKKLERYYEVKITLKQTALKKCTLTGTFTHERIDAVLQAMEYSLDIRAIHVNDTITLSGKGCQ